MKYPRRSRGHRNFAFAAFVAATLLILERASSVNCKLWIGSSFRAQCITWEQVPSSLRRTAQVREEIYTKKEESSSDLDCNVTIREEQEEIRAPSVAGLGQQEDRPVRAAALLDQQQGQLTPTVAVLVLAAVTVLWGAQHAIIKATLVEGDALQAATLNLIRFGLAATCFSFWLPPFSALGQGESRAAREWRGGFELGLWLFLGFCLQTIGLLFTTAQRSGLLLYLNVKLVPFFACALFGREVPLSAWISALAAMTGTLLVAGDGAGGVPPNVGDVLSFAAAAASAMFILRLENYASKTDAKALNAVTMLSVALINIPWIISVAFLDTPAQVSASSALGLISSVSSQIGARAISLLQDHGAAVFYLGVITTAFTNWLQTIGQSSVPATTASVIYALDPLWGCLFAYLLLGETLGPQGLLGAAVLIAVWLYQLVSALDAERAASASAGLSSEGGA